MALNIMSLTQSGLRDWLVQRVSAVILGLYTLVLLVILVVSPNLDYDTWHQLFTQAWMRIFSLLALLSLVLHSYVGIWTVLTDYVKPYGVRLGLEILLVLALFVYLIWGIQILWGL
jgi:succinate dehydrogenase / fumarate reductase membrane anchor subunit